ncbi:MULTISPECIES: GGDEF domain-containing protein [unclassified Bacillus (in: firmicutes)]|uniref:GGDEF domain-containing protein n=1 Tax=unclassified Bacillus (in: firmicutes) TaxID=185979 RepID=UPI0008E6DCEA|nr:MULTISPECIES: GGDEF domain-containing protein [unclassified Bacillus (in: firmicutes)]SFA89107.1 diguanylate cyclase (GGDEF) domain-containing protein [Bacillus sp. UNCCL13]SFQ84792.1 diguanylate cyclase (GGDEF) domain-containing protein [Bacillus sp. cl95]
MKESKEDLYFVRFKKKVYFWILPFLISATFLGWLFDGINNKNDFVMYYMFPALDIWLLFVLFILIFKDKYLPKMEIITMMIISIVYLSWLADLMIFNRKTLEASGGLGEITNWIPLYYIFIFLVFSRRIALMVAGSIFFMSCMIGVISIITFSDVINHQAVDTLFQFYLSNAVYVFALYFLQHLKEAYIHKQTMDVMANTDFLTGMPNRRMLEETLHHFLDHPNKSFSIILFDIDRFKCINDTYGHAAGDTILKELSSLISGKMSQGDVFGRWGGEEFLVILPHMNSNDAASFAETLRKSVENNEFTEVDKVTVSFGVTQYSENDQARHLLKRADIALYNAKDKGRNQVQVQ